MEKQKNSGLIENRCCYQLVCVNGSSDQSTKDDDSKQQRTNKQRKSGRHSESTFRHRLCRSFPHASLRLVPTQPIVVCFIKNNPFGNTYNPWWGNHPNFTWGGDQTNVMGEIRMLLSTLRWVFNRHIQSHNQNMSSSSTSLESFLKENLTPHKPVQKKMLLINEIQSLKVEQIAITSKILILQDLQ